MRTSARSGPAIRHGAASARVRPSLAVALAALVASAGCGSTVQERVGAVGGAAQGGAGTELADSGLGDTPLAGSGTAAGPGSTTTGSAEGTSPLGQPSGERSGAEQGASAGQSGGPRPTATAVASKGGAISVGFLVTTTSSNATLSGAGIDATLGDPQAAVRAVVADLNSRGGVGGRPIKPVFAFLDATSSESYEAQAQAACATFFDDHRVAAVVAPFRADPPLLGCVKKHNVPLLLPTGLAHFTAGDFVSNPTMVSSTFINDDRMMRPYVAGLHAQGYFSAEPGQVTKIGVLHYDLPSQAAVVEKSLATALKERGLAVDERFAATWTTRSSDNADLANEMQSAVLRFRQKGITHVLFLDPGGSMAWFFGTAANNQAYYPRYGYTSQQLPGAFLQGAVPARSLRGSVGVGWLPVFDVDAERDPGVSSSGKRCLDIMKRSGLDMSSRTAQAVAFGVCEGAFLLQQAWATAGGPGTEAFFVGLDRLEGRFVSVSTFSSNPSRTRRDGAAQVRSFRFVEDCTCFEYVGAAKGV